MGGRALRGASNSSMSGLEPVCRRLTYQAGRCESVEQLPRCDLLRPSPQLWRFTTHTHTPLVVVVRAVTVLSSQSLCCMWKENQKPPPLLPLPPAAGWDDRERLSGSLARPPARGCEEEAQNKYSPNFNFFFFFFQSAH